MIAIKGSSTATIDQRRSAGFQTCCIADFQIGSACDPERFAALYEQRRAHYSQAEYRIVVTEDDSRATAAAVLHLPLFR